MKVLLILPKYSHKKFQENIRVVDEEFAKAPPLILLYVASIIENAGVEVKVIDGYINKYSNKEILKQTIEFQPDLIGFRTETYHFPETLGCIKYIKKNVSIPIFVGGVSMNLYPNAVMSHKEIDFGFQYDVINSLPLFINEYKSTHDYSKVPGLFYRQNEKLLSNKSDDSCTSFNKYPFPARHLIDNTKYNSFVSQRKNFTIMVTARGCPYKCTFCAIAPLKFYSRTNDNVIDEIIEVYNKYNVREIDFFDATFFLDKNKSIDLMKKIIDLNYDLVWSCRSRVDLLDDDILSYASRAGCNKIFLGIESQSPDIIKNIRKQITDSQVKNAIRLCHKYDIRPLGFFMIGIPGDTEETIKQTINYAKSLDLDYVQFCRTIPKPGSKLNDMVVEQTGKDYWKEYILTNNIPDRLPVINCDVPEEKLEYYTKKAYISFCFRPKIIIQTLLNAKSITEILRYIRVGLRLLFLGSELNDESNK